MFPKNDSTANLQFSARFVARRLQIKVTCGVLCADICNREHHIDGIQARLLLKDAVGIPLAKKTYERAMGLLTVDVPSP